PRRRSERAASRVTPSGRTDAALRRVFAKSASARLDDEVAEGLDVGAVPQREHAAERQGDDGPGAERVDGAVDGGLAVAPEADHDLRVLLLPVRPDGAVRR